MDGILGPIHNLGVVLCRRETGGYSPSDWLCGIQATSKESGYVYRAFIIHYQYCVVSYFGFGVINT